MSENVIIDPYMLNINEMELLETAMSFFRTLAELCQEQIITIGIYKSLYDKIENRETNPFPIPLNKYTNKQTKEEIIKFNQIFIEVIKPNIICIDIDECSGEQEFSSNYEELQEDDLYFELFCVLLRGCYGKEIIGHKIITSKEQTNLNLSKNLEVSCQCMQKQYIREFLVCTPEDLFSERMKGKQKIKQLLHNNKIDYCESPEVEMGDHHNHLQNDSVKKFSDITRKNKRVLSQLRNFGLQKIIFADFYQQPSYEVGNIRNCLVRKTDQYDIVEGKLYSELGFAIAVKLYFPLEMGDALCQYTNGMFSYREITDLQELI